MNISAVPSCLDLLDGWVNELAQLLPEPVKVPVPGSDFRWKYPVEATEVVLVVKCVRLTTSLCGAWHLANSGLTTESGSLCRQIDDFAAEIWLVAEPAFKGEETAAQRRFVAEFFEPAATSVDEYLNRERQRYVSRADVAKAGERLTREAGLDADQFRDMSSFLTYGLNKYTHGSYESAMELYHGGVKRFLVLGAEGRPRDSAVKFVASKATEACYAVSAAALAMNQPELSSAIRKFVDDVDPHVRGNRA